MQPSLNYERLEVLDTINVMVVGDGGREHAIAWKLAQTSRIGSLAVTKQLPEHLNARDVSPMLTNDIEVDCNALTRYATDENIDLVVVSQDHWLAAGLVDSLMEAGVATWGADKGSAQLESSKKFAKLLMQEAGIATASYNDFTDATAAHLYIESHQEWPVYVKASWPAKGKAAEQADTPAAAHKLIDAMFGGTYGPATGPVIIEELLVGREFSQHEWVDRNTIRSFPASIDHKRIYDDDTGPMTGGVGVVAPRILFGEKDFDTTVIDTARHTVSEPILTVLRKHGFAFNSGILYPGIMEQANGLAVVEYNTRPGNPEMQTHLRRLDSDLLEIIVASVCGKLADIDIAWTEDVAIDVVLCSRGYPNNYEVGKVIHGIDEASKIPGVELFWAGAKKVNGALLTDGGRVLDVTAVGRNLAQARDRAYSAASILQFEGKHYRSDIGLRESQL